MLRPRSFDEVETVGFVGNRRWMDDDAKARMADRPIESRVQTCRKVTAPFGRYFFPLAAKKRPIQIRLTRYRVAF